MGTTHFILFQFWPGASPTEGGGVFCPYYYLMLSQGQSDDVQSDGG